ncbi:exported hypothetical protein [Pseudomonas sp. OF001]|uniref:hypothetical protein n=1 Tax=Pseudomonas sp. OF001 TaxID=2772300 RepID=UPI00199D21AD|nr:exported hypothetical protein [Pseudomonas sp. OF001]
MNRFTQKTLAAALLSLASAMAHAEVAVIVNPGATKAPSQAEVANIFGYTDLMVDGAPSPHQSDTTLRWLIDRLRS